MADSASYSCWLISWIFITKIGNSMSLKLFYYPCVWTNPSYNGQHTTKSSLYLHREYFTCPRPSQAATLFFHRFYQFLVYFSHNFCECCWSGADFMYFCHCLGYSMCNESAHLLLHSMERPFSIVCDHDEWHGSNFWPFFRVFLYEFNKCVSPITFWSILSTSNVAILTR